MKTKLFILLIIIFPFLTSCSDNFKKDIVGEWRGVNLEVDADKIYPQLLKNGKIVTKATIHRFNTDGTYSTTILKNSLNSISRKYKGKIILDETNKQLTLIPDSSFFEIDGSWEFKKKAI